jgi:hypothetical protein
MAFSVTRREKGKGRRSFFLYLFRGTYLSLGSAERCDRIKSRDVFLGNRE